MAISGLLSGGRFVQLEVFAPPGGGHNASPIKRAGARTLVGIAFIELAAATVLFGGVTGVTRGIHIFGVEFETHGFGIAIGFAEFLRSGPHGLAGCQAASRRSRVDQKIRRSVFFMVCSEKKLGKFANQTNKMRLVRMG